MLYCTDFRSSRERVATFNTRGWCYVIREGIRTGNLIEKHWEIMGNFDPAHHTKLIVDECGVWYPPGRDEARDPRGEGRGWKCRIRDAEALD